MLTDLRDAFRALRAFPVVTAVAVLSLALGIGANTAIFSIVNSLMLKSLPVAEPDRLVQIAIGERQTYMTNPQWEQIRDRPELFDSVFVWSNARFDLASGGQTEYVNGLWVSGRFFEGLGVPAMLGRTLTPEDDRRGGGPDGPVAVISYAFWQRRYAGAADAVGKAVSLERVSFTIVGVTPPEFTGVEAGTRLRRGRAARRRTADSRPGHCSRSPVDVVAADGRPIETRAEPRGGAGRAARRAAANP